MRLTAGGCRRRPITRFNQANLTTARTSTTTDRDKPKPGKVCAAKSDAPTPKTDLQRRKEVPAAVAAAAAAAREQPIAPSGNSSTDARPRLGRKVPMRCIFTGKETQQNQQELETTHRRCATNFQHVSNSTHDHCQLLLLVASLSSLPH